MGHGLLFFFFFLTPQLFVRLEQHNQDNNVI